MAIYRVTYQSMTAFYGPKFVEADDADEARRKFAGTAFSADEIGLIRAREVSAAELKRALAESEE